MSVLSLAMRSNAGMADRGTSTCALRKSPPPVNTLAWPGTKCIRKGVTGYTYIMSSHLMTHQDRRHYARMPGHEAPWTGHTTAHLGHLAVALSTTRSRLISTADLRQINRVASGSSQLAADRRPRHHMTTQLCTSLNSRRQNNSK